MPNYIEPDYIKPDHIKIATRWSQAHAANNYAKWHALMTWMAAESMYATLNNLPDVADYMSALSDRARRHVIDLQPVDDRRIAG